MMDEKGRLFGKINIVDLLVLVVVVIALVVVGMKFLLPSRVGGGAKKTHVTYTVLVENVRPEVYENIQNQIPSTLMAAGELLDGQVVAVSAEPHVQEATLGNVSNTLVLPIGEGNLDLTFSIECNVVNTITTEIGTQEVRIGKAHIVKTDRFELDRGIILSCNWETAS